MNKSILIILVLISFMDLRSQESFLKLQKVQGTISDIITTVQLSNGNFVCAIRRSAASFGPTVCEIFLFDKCGDLINSIVLDYDQRWISVNNMVEIDRTGQLLCNGHYYSPDDYHQTYHFILDGTNLDLIEEVKYYERNFITYETQVLERELIHYGVWNDVIGITRMNKNLVRNVHLTLHPRANFSGNINYVGLVGDKMLIRKETEEYQQLLFLNRKLQTVSSVTGIIGTHYSYFGDQLIRLNSNSFLIEERYFDNSENLMKYYITKYRDDSLVWRKPGSYSFRHLNGYETWLNRDDTIVGISYTGEVGFFDKDADFIRSSHRLKDQIEEGDIISRYQTSTSDGGLFTVKGKLIYNPEQQRTDYFLKLIKTNSQFYIENDSTNCDATFTVSATRSDLNVYPNPTSDVLYLEFQNPSSGVIKVTNLNAKIIMSRKFRNQRQLQLQLGQFPQGMYLLEYFDVEGRNYSRSKVVIQ